MRIELGSLVSVLREWVLCIDECNRDCSICVSLPEWAGELGEAERLYLALYLAARTTMDYRVAAAMHVHSIRSRAVVRPELLVRALREAKVVSRALRVLEDESPYAWEAVLYRGVLYARAIIGLDRPVVVKVEPPRDKRAKEKLRVLIEEKRVIVEGRTRYVEGLLERPGGEKLAPWVYLVPKRRVPELLEQVRVHRGAARIAFLS